MTCCINNLSYLTFWGNLVFGCFSLIRSYSLYCFSLIFLFFLFHVDSQLRPLLLFFNFLVSLVPISFISFVSFLSFLSFLSRFSRFSLVSLSFLSRFSLVSLVSLPFLSFISSVSRFSRFLPQQFRSRMKTFSTYKSPLAILTHRWRHRLVHNNCSGFTDVSSI